MADRYFVEPPISSDRATLSGAEAHHLIHVMRATPGTQVTLFDGSGDEFAATVARVGRSEIELAIDARATVDRELPFTLTLGVALPKGDRQKWLVEKAVEIGITQIVPLNTQRSVAQPVEQAIARLRRAVIEASKQCGRNRLMTIAAPQSWPEFVAAASLTASRLLAHPGGEILVTGKLQRSAKQEDRHSCLSKTAIPVHKGTDRNVCPPDNAVLPMLVGQAFHRLDRDAIIAIGPEGGFTDEEVALAVAAGWNAVDLGPRILRVETAAILLASLVIGRD